MMDNIEKELIQILELARQEAAADMPPLELARCRGRVLGLETALDLIQRAADPAGAAAPAEEAPGPEKPRLFDLSPDTVAAMTPDEICRDHAPAHLVEAAFRFENQLMTLLGDENFIDYQAYEGLAPEELARIVLQCTHKIARLNG